MAANISSIVDLIHPAASGIGIITTDQVWVVFDREIDESTITAGNFFVTGPDFDTWIGPDLQLFNEAISTGSGSDDILASPGFLGLVQGEITFERLELISTTVIDDLDTVGSGLLYRTKAIFTPTNRLQSNTEYTVYISGDEDSTDTLLTGISERTVFDTVASGANTGTGDVSFVGGYDGSLNDVFHLTITTAGELGESRFTFERDSEPSGVFGPFKTKKSGVLLSDGVLVEFTEGDYDLGDQWSVLVEPQKIFSGNLNWSFKTGSGSISILPSTTATTVIGDIPASTSTSSSSSSTSSFSVVSTDPEDGDTNLVISPGEFTIAVEFSDPIDATTVTSGISVVVHTGQVDGEIDGDALGDLIAQPLVSGVNLYIVVASGQFHENELVTVTLDDSISSTGAVSLSSDYVFEFTTRYNPLYCTVRKLRLFIGLFVNQIPDDTLNFAIHMASLKADALTWNKCHLDDAYYQFVRSEWTCCVAAQILLLNTTGGSGLIKSKTLGDLSVAYDTSGNNINHALDRAMQCQAKWETALMAGGRQVQLAQGAVKGILDPDRPPIGRGWVHTRSLQNTQTPAANTRGRFSHSRRIKNLYSGNLLTNRKGWWNR